VAAATKLWDGTGSFVFTSSMSVCAAEDGGEVSDEVCPLVPPGKAPGTDRLLGAEGAALAAGGNVVRLVGLYHAQRGPHTFFIRQGEVARYGGYTVNMLHYEDAAALAVAVLRGDGAQVDAGAWRGRVFVGTDGHPLTFDEMVEACFASGVFSGAVKFTGAAPTDGTGLGKRVSNATTRRLLGGWQPKYSSFKDFFVTTKGSDFYTSSGLF
jgi:nucleoside-diphosphate-sugar epimerase